MIALPGPKSRERQLGTAWINTHFTLVYELPHGGYKQSDYGNGMGTYSLEEYMQIKHIMASHD